MNGKKKQNWKRPGARINIYFRNMETLRKLDRMAKQRERSRAAQIEYLINDEPK